MEYNVLDAVRRLTEAAPDGAEPDVTGYYYFLSTPVLSTNPYIYVTPTFGVSNLGVSPDG
jgi:hypothetical protein